MKSAVIMLLILFLTAHQAKAECKVVEYEDRSEVVCEEATTPAGVTAAPIPPPSYEERRSSGYVVKDAEMFTGIAKEVSELIQDDGDPDAVLVRMRNLPPIYDAMREATTNIADKDRNLARLYEAQLTTTKELWAELLITSGSFMMKKNRDDDAKELLRFLSINFQEREFAKNVKQADFWLKDLAAR